MVQAEREDVAGEGTPPGGDGSADVGVGPDVDPDARADARAGSLTDARSGPDSSVGSGARPDADTGSAVDDAQPSRPDGRTTRWEQHRAARRLDLVRAARRSVHERGPDVSMDELATDIGTSKSILYRYFTDKAGLQRAVGGHVLDRMLRELTEAATGIGGPRERIHSMVAHYLQMVDDAPHVYAFVTSPAIEASSEVRGFVEEVDAVVAHTLVPAVLGLEDDADIEEIPRELAARATLWAAGVTGTVRSVADRWLAARAALERDGIALPSDGGAPLAGTGSAGAAAASVSATGDSAGSGDAMSPAGTSSSSSSTSSTGAPARPSPSPTPDRPDRTAVPGAVVGGPLHPDLESTLAGIDRSELAAFIASWLWDGAVGVLRRARTDTRPRTVTQNRTDKDVP